MACSGKHQFNEETLSKRLLWQLDIPEHTQTQSILLDSTGIILLWWPLVASLLVLVYLNISLSIELQGSTYLSSLPLSPLTELLCTFVFILFSCCPWLSLLCFIRLLVILFCCILFWLRIYWPYITMFLNVLVQLKLCSASMQHLLSQVSPCLYFPALDACEPVPVLSWCLTVLPQAVWRENTRF